MIAVLLSFVLAILNTAIVLIGLFSGFSFEEWVPFDIILIVSNILYAIIFFAKKKKDTGGIFLAIIGAFIFGFIAHMRFGYWILLDLTVVGTSIYGIIDSIAIHRNRKSQRIIKDVKIE